jgi:ferric-dicitrate binding protein FerR (iron transport regulator)
MRRFLATLCLTTGLAWAISARAGEIVLESPPGVPAGLSAPMSKELESQRGALLEQFSATKDAIHSQAQDCGNVEKDSPKAAECIARAGDVRTAVKAYRVALAQFKTNLQKSLDLLAMEKALSAPTRDSARPISIDSQGEVHLVRADGGTISSPNAKAIAEDEDARLVTGATGTVMLTFADGTRIRLGPNSVFRPYAPAASAGEAGDKGPMMRLLKGGLRWAHEVKESLLESSEEGAVRSNRERHRRLGITSLEIGVQGTDFECAVGEDDSGWIRLYSGTIELNPGGHRDVVALKPGEMITFHGGTISEPMPIH